MYGGVDDGGEDGLIGNSGSFDDAAIRKGFIRKVYGILNVQLIVTMGIMALFQIPELKEYSYSNIWLVWTAIAITIVCLIALGCCPGVRRKFPANLICLGVFTVAEGFLLGCVTATYRVDEVLMAVGICAILVLALTIFALQTRFDFTAFGGILIIGLLCLLIIGIAAIIVRNKILSIVYASIGAFLFCCYIVMDTQLMMGGKHKYSLDPEEYIFASLNLYLDVINLFLFILDIIGCAFN